MGSSGSKEVDPTKNLAPPKPGQIDALDKTKLVAINLREINVPKPPVIKTQADLKREKEEERLKGLVAFDLSKDYDMEKLTDRFLKQFNSINPRNYLYTDTQIKAK